jgi:hypothetical protein
MSKTSTAVALLSADAGDLVGSEQGYVLDGFLFDPRTDTYVVVLRRPFRNLDPYVTGRVDRLTDREWRQGRYFSGRNSATVNMVQRAGVNVE